MSTHAKIFLLFCTVAAVTFGQQAATKTGDQHALILPGKLAAVWTFHDETRQWLSVESANHRDFQKEGYNPSYVYVLVRDYKPIIKQIGKDKWQITFTSPLAEDLP